MLLFALLVTDDKPDSIAACIVYWVKLRACFYAIVVAAVI